MKHHPPSATLWQHWPLGWYAVARANALKPGHIISGQLAGRHWVAWRSHTGHVLAADAFCPHMGAHLSSAQIAGGDLLCALHGCRVRPRNPQHPAPNPAGVIPIRAWPCAERFGLLWLHPPLGQPAPLPFADVANNHRWIWPRPLLIDADWRAMIANGFDLTHMRVVHQRAVAGQPQFDRLPEGGVRMRYRTRVLPGGGWSSWLMQRLSGGMIELSHSCNGSNILVQSRVGPFATTAVFALLPQDAPGAAPETRRTLAQAAIGIPRHARWPALQLRVARALYLAFLRKDFEVVRGMRLQLAGIDDVGVCAVAAYQNELPSAEAKPQH